MFYVSAIFKALIRKCGKKFFYNLIFCIFQGQAAASCTPQNTTLDVNVFVDPVFLNISQYAIHTVDTALHSWQQVTQNSGYWDCHTTKNTIGYTLNELTFKNQANNRLLTLVSELWNKVARSMFLEVSPLKADIRRRKTQWYFST